MGRAAFTGKLARFGSFDAITPVILSQTRTTFSFLILLPVLLMNRGWTRLRVPRGDFIRLIAFGILGVAASNYFYYLAIQRTNVAIAIIVQYTAPVWVLLYMVARGKERPTTSKMASVMLASVGVAFVIGLFGQRQLHLDTIGVVAAVLASFSFTFYNIGGHAILARLDRWIVLLYTTMAASLFWIVVNPPSRIAAAHYSGAAWLFLAIFAVLSVLVPFSLYFAGLQHLQPTNAIIASCLEPVFAIVIAAISLHEVMKPVQAAGVLMVLAAIVVVQRPVRGEPPVPSAGPVD